MTSTVPAALRALVVDRAGNRCEYCRLSQDGQEATFHVGHVVPQTAGGPTDEDNLALACVGCSLRKGARQHGPDPETSDDAPLFNPGRDLWSTHFAWNGANVAGLSPTGRATAAALAMNRPLMVAIREEEVLLGRHAER